MTKPEDTKYNQTPIPQTPMRYILHISGPHKRWAFGALFFVSLAQILSTSIPYIFRSIIDTANEVSQGIISISDIWFWAIVYPVVTLMMFAAWRTSGFIGMQWATRANATSYTTLFRYLSHHSHSYFSDRFAGSLSSKVGHASEGAQSLIEAFMWNYFSTVLSLLLTLVYIASSSTMAALIYLILLAVLIPMNIALAKYRRPHVVKYSEQATRARGVSVDSITNMSAVRQFSMRANEHERFNSEITQMRSLNLKQWRISEWSLSLNNIIIVAFEAAVVLVSVHLWTSSAISIGELVMIITLMINVQGALVFIGSSMNGFVRRYGEIEEGLTDILLEHEIVDDPNAQPLKVNNATIDWNKVGFKFDGKSVFADFDLHINAGQRLGLVGHSGAGKTTFVSLLLRQHDLDDGSISIAGQNIAEVKQDSLRQAIAVVPQEPALFHRSIRDNILYGNPEATGEELIEAAKRAQAHDFIVELPLGYDTMVGERGVKLSGGQKQRVAIARAMLKNAPILILDEATSALDSESEVAIQKALEKLMEGRTVIAIAHRLSTLRKMDRIIVMEGGSIIEDGPHETLAQAGGVYQRLWNHQAGGFLED